MRHAQRGVTAANQTDLFDSFLMLVLLMLMGLALTMSAYAQPAQTWSYSFPENEIQYAGINDVMVTPDGNVLIAGRWNDHWEVRSVDLATGTFQWQLADALDSGRATSLALVDDGSVDVIVGGDQYANPYDGILKRISTDGTEIWSRPVAYNQPANTGENVGDLLVISPDRVYACGQYADRPALGWVNVDDPTDDRVFYRLPNLFPQGKALAASSSGMVVVAGYHYDFPSSWATVAQVNSSGQLQWLIEDQDMDMPEGITVTADGTVIYVGSTNRLNAPDPARIAALSIEGNPLWAMEHGLSFSVYHDVCVSDPAGSNEVYVCGQIIEQQGGPNRQILHKISSAGDILWTLYGDDGGGAANKWSAVAALPDGGLIVAGTHVITPGSSYEHVIERYDP